MSDILSGGVIDDSTDGPIPSKMDDRSRDIIAEQKEVQRQNSIGGTEPPPTIAPPDQILEPPQIAPPLPVIPSFDFGASVPVIENTREIARQATIDVLKNVTINGQSASIDGSAISFNIPQQQSASEIFSSTTRLTAEDFGTGGNKQFIQPAYGSLSEYSTFGREEKQPETIPSRLDSKDFGTTGSVRGPAYGSLTEIDSKYAYQEAEKRREERRESDQNFDRYSSIRQRGETPREFKERQEELKKERAEQIQTDRERREFAEKSKEGGTMEPSSGMVPVAFTRADGQKKILAYLASDYVGTVEGGGSGERTTNLPSEDNYYEAGGGSIRPHPWQILLRAENDVVQYKIESASRLYSGLGSWDDIEVDGIGTWNDVSEGYVVLFGVIDGGVCTEASIQVQSTISDRIDFADDTQTSFAAQLGYLYQEGDSWLVRQNAFHNFTLIDSCVNGNPAIYPIAT